MIKNSQSQPKRNSFLLVVLLFMGFCCYAYPTHALSMNSVWAQNRDTEKVVMDAIAKGTKNAASATASAPNDETALVYINIATEEELCSLPGIGPKKAQDIIAYRQKHPFRRLNQLLNIKGIGRKTLERLQPFVKLDMQKPVVSATNTATNALQNNNQSAENTIPPLLRRPE